MGRIKYSATPAAIVGGVLPYTLWSHVSSSSPENGYSSIPWYSDADHFERRFFGRFTKDLKGKRSI